MLQRFFPFVLLVLLSAFAGAAPSGSFQKGNDAYAAGDFKTAKQLYLETATQTPDENAWFNLGNACFRLNEPGQAALAYERALALSPHHAEAVENLRFVRQKTGAQAGDRFWLARVFQFTPPAAAPWIAVSLSWLGFAWAGSALWRRTGRGGVIGGALLVLLGAAYGAGLAWWRAEQNREAIVVATSAEAKSEPSVTARAAMNLTAGSRVRLLSSVAGWHYAELPNGTSGWMAEKDLQTITVPRP